MVKARLLPLTTQHKSETLGRHDKEFGSRGRGHGGRGGGRRDPRGDRDSRHPHRRGPQVYDDYDYPGYTDVHDYRDFRGCRDRTWERSGRRRRWEHEDTDGESLSEGEVKQQRVDRARKRLHRIDPEYAQWTRDKEQEKNEANLRSQNEDRIPGPDERGDWFHDWPQRPASGGPPRP